MNKLCRASTAVKTAFNVPSDTQTGMHKLHNTSRVEKITVWVSKGIQNADFTIVKVLWSCGMAFAEQGINYKLIQARLCVREDIESIFYHCSVPYLPQFECLEGSQGQCLLLWRYCEAVAWHQGKERPRKQLPSLWRPCEARASLFNC